MRLRFKPSLGSSASPPRGESDAGEAVGRSAEPWQNMMTSTSLRQIARVRRSTLRRGAPDCSWRGVKRAGIRSRPERRARSSRPRTRRMRRGLTSAARAIPRFRDSRATSASARARPSTSRSRPIRQLQILVYRLGYYGGLGARKVATLDPFTTSQNRRCRARPTRRRVW